MQFLYQMANLNQGVIKKLLKKSLMENFIFCAVKTTVMMNYWDGSKISLEKKYCWKHTEQLLALPDLESIEDFMPLQKLSPPRKLNLEQEFLVVLMRLRTCLLTENLTFRFYLLVAEIS